MSILALDVSLTSTGIAYPTAEGPDPYYVSRVTPKKLRGSERLTFVTRIVSGTIQKRMEECSLIVMEGPAFGMQQNNSRAHSLGELHGAIKYMAYQGEIDILTVPPSNLKKFVTGSGNADKKQVIAAVEEMWGFATTHDDEADAFGLLQLGYAYKYPRKRRRYDSARKDALMKCHLERN